MSFHYVPARDCPDDSDARAEQRNEREYRRAVREGDDYVPRRWARTTRPAPVDTKEQRNG